MIQITAYLRTEEDKETWAKLDNKTEWLHNQLQNIRDLRGHANLTDAYVGNGDFAGIKTVDPHTLSPGTKLYPPGITKIPGGGEVAVSKSRITNGICKLHGTPLDSRGKCLQKGCKYA